ncbi:MAG: SpoVA/SpoVAEb family sporulation membrane protein [Eggerthellaceae bacterium]|nr:SpoVA/SpoVAEb family sporulation membrane protein [Eggerthellaceae bacterium]
MMYLQAFLVGGLLCAIFQIALMYTKLGVPKLLIIGLALGGLATAFGLCDYLAEYGGAGFTVMVVGAAQAIFNSLMALFAGTPLPICIVIAIFAVLTLFGLFAGIIYRAMHKSSASTPTNAEADIR